MSNDSFEMPFLRLPRLPELNLPKFEEANPAKWAHERIVRSIIAFEEELEADQEIGARLVNFSAREPIHIDDVGYWGPDFVIFNGKNLDGNPVELIQHISQVNVLLVAIKVTTDKPNRIGFVLAKKLEGEKEEDDE
ncbi:DUF6173 family protein [Mesorhizobium sp. M7A.F.Ca.US.008.03.1.1]|uniref:DUF6173 family protein n=1 Tax=Mesorhizobium sp. M7A.F.Ca.US.008.03.1.1 TaxID=2496742 RepID=UPI000FCB5512|nr:DUF6173 family protein [Mesorhizobium sp. M7A.F.Ca.US.008.03.1.1]RUW58362.1 hypothetical protein EOA16_28035 [Mesorhizobium sp. M7A.F.Ca.US.008.03.1.1]